MSRSPVVAGAVRRLGAVRASWALKQLHDGDDPTAASARTLRWLLRPRTWLPSWRAEVAVASLLHIVSYLAPSARSQLVAGLSHAELRAWHRLLGAVPPAARDATYTAVGEHVPLHVWRRFGRWTDDIDPDPSGDLRDLARIPDPLPDEVAAQERHWATLTGPLATRGVADAHEYAGNDLVQGHIGNCYLVAALQEIADTAPERLAELCSANDNGTWTVTLPNGRRTVVSPDIVVDVHGNAVFARRPPNSEQELWPLLLEKAYAQLHGGWREIVTGHPYDAIELFTGVRAQVVRGPHLELARSTSGTGQAPRSSLPPSRFRPGRTQPSGSRMTPRPPSGGPAGNWSGCTPATPSPCTTSSGRRRRSSCATRGAMTAPSCCTSTRRARASTPCTSPRSTDGRGRRRPTCRSARASDCGSAAPRRPRRGPGPRAGRGPRPR